MSNFVETVKLFYSQGFHRVFDEGQHIDIKFIQPSWRWAFHFHGLEIEELEELEEEEFVDEYVYELRFSFNLQKIHRYLPDLRRFNEMPKCMAVDGENDSEAVVDQLPDSVWKSYNFYHEALNKLDWGSAYAFRITIEGQDTLAIRAITDGDDGWLEVFDTQGNNLASARTSRISGSAIAWRPTNLIREQVYKEPRFPPELE